MSFLCSQTIMYALNLLKCQFKLLLHFQCVEYSTFSCNFTIMVENHRKWPNVHLLLKIYLQGSNIAMTQKAVLFYASRGPNFLTKLDMAHNYKTFINNLVANVTQKFVMPPYIFAHNFSPLQEFLCKISDL